MNTLISEDRPPKQTLESRNGDLSGLDDLSQEEIEAGLLRLQSRLQFQRLPRVVLVEDEEADAQLFKRALESLPFPIELMHFCDGQQAMDFFRGRGSFSDRERFPLPHLAVVDLKLTRGTGLEILRFIRSERHFDPLFLVVLTASDDKEEAAEARSLCINDWINKPESHAELIDLVSRMIRTWLGVTRESGKLP